MDICHRDFVVGHCAVVLLFQAQNVDHRAEQSLKIYFSDPVGGGRGSGCVLRMWNQTLATELEDAVADALRYHLIIASAASLWSSIACVFFWRKQIPAVEQLSKIKQVEVGLSDLLHDQSLLD
jgi:hypothetical protein